MAGVALLRIQITTSQPSDSFSTTEPFSHLRSSDDGSPFTRPQHQTHVAFSKTCDMVSSLSRAHLLTLTLVLSVLSTAHLYGKCRVLCSVMWGVSVPFVWRRHQKNGAGGARDGSDTIGMFIFYSLTSSLTLSLVSLALS